MKGNEFLDKMELIDSAYVEAAAAEPGKRKHTWRARGAMAACLCLVIGGIAAYQAGLFKAPAGIGTTTDAVETVAYGFCLEGNDAAWYFPISLDARRQYGLVPEGAVGLSKDNTYRITKEDLGARMGIVSECGDETMIGCEVYHFAKYPDKDSICIADTPNGYAFYVCEWLRVKNEIGTSSDVLLAAYELPESLERMEVLTPDFQHIADVEDAEVVEAVFAILSGKTNSGLEANERRFAQAWYDAYGNDDVYYSEEDGCCMYRAVGADKEEYVEYTDGEGNTVAQNTAAPDISLYDKAHDLWSKGERVLLLTTEKGYQLSIDYYPLIRTWICGDGYYEISPDEVEAMNALLQIAD